MIEGLVGVRRRRTAGEAMSLVAEYGIRQSKPRLAASVGVRSDSWWMDLFASAGRISAR